MRLTATTTVLRPPSTVWDFLADPSNSPSWDASVAEVVPIGPGAPAVGWAADTVSPRGKRQRFRITVFEPCRTLAFRLVGDRTFERAELRFDLVAGGDGEAGARATEITHTIELRTRNVLTAPVLAAVGRRALARDLGRLRAALHRLDPGARQGGRAR